MPTILRVDDDQPAGGGEDGSNWTDKAFHDPQLALAYVAAFPGSAPFEIWVAEGVYKPGPAGALGSTFLIPDDVEGMYGGFLPGDLSKSTRSGNFNQTILSGDLDGVPSDISGDAHNVVTIPATSLNTRLDGFRVTRGNAPDAGGAVLIGDANLSQSFTDVTVANCVLKQNHAVRGGGIAAIFGSRLVIKSCIFRNNSGDGLGVGGGLYLGTVSGSSQDDHANVWNCKFDDNTAGNRGGGIAIFQSHARLCNNVMHDNSASVGGAIYIDDDNGGAGLDTLMSNCTIAFNEAFGGPSGTGGGGIFVDDKLGVVTGERKFLDSIFWGNTAIIGGSSQRDQIGGPNYIDDTTIKHCDIQGPWPFDWPGQTNISTDPLFTDASGRNLRLAAGSPCIDAGDDFRIRQDLTDLDENGQTWQEDTPFDFTGSTPRERDDLNTPDTGVEDSDPTGIGDMGAYEF